MRLTESVNHRGQLIANNAKQLNEIEDDLSSFMSDDISGAENEVEK